MTEYQKSNLKELVQTNEQFNGYRIVIDYAIALAADGSALLRNEMEDYVQELYKTSNN